jgi:hypothetical protein
LASHPPQLFDTGDFQGCDNNALQFLYSIGVTSAMDLAGWTVMEVQHAMDGQSQLMCSQILAAHAAATATRKRAVDRRARAVVVKQVLPTSPAPSWSLPPIPARSRTAAAPPQAAPSVAMAAAQTFVGLFKDALPFSEFRDEVAALDDASVDVWFSALAASLAHRFQPTTIKAATAAWHRWAAWFKAQQDIPLGTSLFAPPPLALYAFFQESHARGRTVGKATHSALAWASKCFKLCNFQLDHPLVQPFLQAQDHIQHQQEPLSLAAFRHLVALAGSCSRLSTPVSFLAAVVLFVLASGLRYAHVCRASLVTIDGRFITVHISKGKTRRGQPFRVAVPTHVGPDRDIISLLFRVVAQGSPPGDPAIIVPDIVMGPLGLHESTFALAPRHLSYTKFHLFMRHLLCLQPLALPDAEAAAFTSYSLRRWLPSVAHALGIPPSEAASLGNWVDVADPAARPGVPLAVRYSATRLEVSAELKLLCLAAVWHLLKHHPRAQLRDLVLCRPHLPALRETVLRNHWGLMGSAGMLPGPVSPVAASPSETSEGSSSSESDGSASPLKDAPLMWALPPGRATRLHLVADTVDGRLAARCGRKFCSWETGHSLASARATARSWCALCAQDLPECDDR